MHGEVYSALGVDISGDFFPSSLFYGGGVSASERPRIECAIYTVRGQNFSSDALFTPKIDIFKQTILNTAYIKTLEIFPSARESLSIERSTSRSVRNQSCLHCS